MSLKSIEMQIALPRTHDAGKIQEQIQQRGQLHNDLAAQSVQKEEEKKRTSVIKQEQKDSVHLHNQNEDKNGQQSKGQKKKKEEEVIQKEKHPYKGTLLDFSG